jgi:cell wall assembly regulator SMI1
MRRPDEAYASTGDDRQVLNVDEGLAAALARLEAILKRSRAAIVPLLHPGIGEREVLRTLQGIGLTPSAEVVTWFGWHNGAGEPGMPTTHIHLVPAGEFYDLRFQCGQYQDARSAAVYVASSSADLPSKTGFHATADDFWRVSWFPLLSLIRKGSIAVDLGAGKTTSPVHIVWADSDLDLRSRPVWPTIRAFVETVIARFEEGTYWVNDEGVVDGNAMDHWSEQNH